MASKYDGPIETLTIARSNLQDHDGTSQMEEEGLTKKADVEQKQAKHEGET